MKTNFPVEFTNIVIIKKTTQLLLFRQYFIQTFNRLGLGIIVFKATFNNISAISWWSVLLVEETGVPRENHRPATSH